MDKKTINNKKINMLNLKKFTSSQLKEIQCQIKDELFMRRKKRIINYMKSFGIKIIKESEFNGLFAQLSWWGIKPPVDKREIRILKLRYGKNRKKYTLQEIGKLFNLSGERIRQIEKMALLKLSDYEKSPIYQNFLKNRLLEIRENLKKRNKDKITFNENVYKEKNK